MKERADSKFRIALERLFQRLGAECEKTCVHTFLYVLKECTVYKCQQKSGVDEKVHKSQVGQQGI